MNHKTKVLQHIIRADDNTMDDDNVRAISIGLYSRFIELCEQVSQDKKINKINTTIGSDDINFSVIFEDGELITY